MATNMARIRFCGAWRALAWCWLLGLAMSLFGGIGGSIVGLSAGVVLLVVSLFGFSYKLHLHRLGYEWPTLMDANWILLRLGWRKAYRLPPAADVETLPEIGSGDPDSIIAFVKRLERHRRELEEESRRRPSQGSPGA